MKKRELLMTLLQNHQSALDSFMEDKAIQDLKMLVYIPHQIMVGYGEYMKMY